MSFFDLPADSREKLFDELRQLYDDFDEQTRDLPAPHGSCAGCGRCCISPPLYMTLSDLEYAYAMQYVEQNNLGHQVHFEEAAPDRRHAFSSWTCPFYSHSAGCTV